MLGTSLTPNPNKPGTPRILGCRQAQRTSKLQLVAISAATTQSGYGLSRSQVSRVRLKMRSDCEIGISIYPNFSRSRYNAVGGGGWGSVQDLGNGKLALRFDTDVHTRLTTEDMAGAHRSAQGTRLAGNTGRLAGVAQIGEDGRLVARQLPAAAP